MTNYAKLPPSSYYTYRLPIDLMVRFAVVAADMKTSKAALMRAAVAEVVEAYEKEKQARLNQVLNGSPKRVRKMGAGRNK